MIWCFNILMALAMMKTMRRDTIGAQKLSIMTERVGFKCASRTHRARGATFAHEWELAREAHEIQVLCSGKSDLNLAHSEAARINGLLQPFKARFENARHVREKTHTDAERRTENVESDERRRTF
jgi:hypothetical protein